jgi:hypothetical protein
VQNYCVVDLFKYRWFLFGILLQAVEGLFCKKSISGNASRTRHVDSPKQDGNIATWALGRNLQGFAGIPMTGQLDARTKRLLGTSSFTPVSSFIFLFKVTEEMRHKQFSDPLHVNDIWLLFSALHKVHICLEYHSVCPVTGIGTPHPLSRK